MYLCHNMSLAILGHIQNSFRSVCDMRWLYSWLGMAYHSYCRTYQLYYSLDIKKAYAKYKETAIWQMLVNISPLFLI